jgi:hypothetical protein
MKTKTVIIIMMAFISSALFAEGNWHKIGETTVDFKKEKEEIKVGGNDHYTALKFKVTDAPIDLIDFDVYFDGDESPQNIKVHTPVQTNAESRVIQIKDNDKGIQKIVFVYRTLPNRKDEKATVEVWGMRKDAKDKDGMMHKDKDEKKDDKK